MIDPAYVATMSRYNRWQNESIYAATDTLDDDARRADRGSFFHSIHGTLCHILWGDRTWMSRFAGSPAPDIGIAESPTLIDDWKTLCAERRAFDETIDDWAATLDAEWLDGNLTWYSGAAKQEIAAPRALLVMHMFNHQTHHRGQVHAMLTAAGARPDDTDLMLLAIRS